MDYVKTDLLVIGAGSGGLSVASGAAQMGADVTLLEGGRMGGDCLNYGCVPSKSLLAAGKAAQAHRGGAAFGVTPGAPEVDFAAAQRHVADVIDQIAPHDSVERFEALGVRVIQEYGHFVSPSEVEAGNCLISARRIVIATGSSPLVPPIPGLIEVPYLTNETVFDLRERPGHLLIIGGGPIGIELAQAHRRLGCEVTVIEGARALGQDDTEMAGIVLDALREEGVQIEEHAMAAQVRQRDGAVEVEVTDGRVFEGSHLLIAVGRKANVERLNLEAAGIEATGAGVAVNASLRSSNRRVYAIGDAAGGMQFTHVAGYHAGLVIRSALFGLPVKARTSHLPRATYSDPELAQIGLTEQEARDRHGVTLKVMRVPYAENDRARAERQTEGMIKLMVVEGRPVGVSIVGQQAGELIALWSMVMAHGLRLSAVAGMVAPYPTYAELNKRVAGAFFSPRLFESPTVKRVVRLVQRWLP
ncbi:Pyruvate/2-oxoglutarate dehydrogenase complex, dihydrolipoamide dehydrogenase (E3) component [Salinihabitans flavidus]|uniref:Pyruvate/2-oxoglutarate dehydrogenase complex, dihydrolipoamide dehydrogenase (E3) component n=1 Tax=Salinihabitans flavidus TaxID=569882 RepID=A0A1H8SEP5_9RHOB|nr:FAD-dependent oxidoreductase [Salinihabitans flavidus]SEO77499.1 Pyruvate/2-oxoglutarate dehydrogenase complex, dihydrolipoamide dehydrogenase (E3) component [Salinihabitans flavidus]